MNKEINKNKELNIWEALIPVIVLIGLLAYNVLVAYNGEDDDPLAGSNQFVLLLGAGVAVVVGLLNKVSFHSMIEEVSNAIAQV